MIRISCVFFLLALSWPARAAPLPVFVSVLPQAYFVERVGGEHVAVSVMVGPGKSPELYEPGARQMAQLGEARLYFRIGMPFEEVWLKRLAETYPNLRLVDHREVAGAPPAHGHDEHDPHLWSSPLLVRKMAEQIRAALSAADPAHREAYAANCGAFQAELEQLHNELQAILKPFAGRSFLVFHPAWGYFAEAFGLRQEAVESEGKEPGGRRLAELIELARRESLKVIFVQPQSDRRHAETIAQAIGARVVSLDPLARDYPANLRQVAAALADSF